MPRVRLSLDSIQRSVKRAMDLEKEIKTPKEMRAGTIILEGDLKVKIRAFDSQYCVIRFGKKYNREATLPRRFMNFRYAKEKVRAIAP